MSTVIIKLLHIQICTFFASANFTHKYTHTHTQTHTALDKCFISLLQRKLLEGVVRVVSIMSGAILSTEALDAVVLLIQDCVALRKGYT